MPPPTAPKSKIAIMKGFDHKPPRKLEGMKLKKLPAV